MQKESIWNKQKVSLISLFKRVKYPTTENDSICLRSQKWSTLQNFTSRNTEIRSQHVGYTTVTHFAMSLSLLR